MLRAKSRRDVTRSPNAQKLDIAVVGAQQQTVTQATEQLATERKTVQNTCCSAQRVVECAQTCLSRRDCNE